VDTPDLSRARWKKSSRSSGNGQCVEWANLGDVVAVRDSKDQGEAVLVFAPGEWAAFVAAVKAGEIDRP
jgi:hypothetical protein